MSELTQCLSVSPISLNMISSGSFHGVSDGRISSLFLAEWYCITPHFPYPFVFPRMLCVSAVVNHVAVDTGAGVSAPVIE